MNARIIIQEDSITPYLNEIENRLYASRKELIYELGKRFAETASENAPDWTGNLKDSIADSDLWQLYTEDDFMQLDIIFTGLTGDVDQWWGEFEDDRFPEGGRDYAYFQETGQDLYADADKARSKWYVRKSAEPTWEFTKSYLDKEIMRIMGVK